MKRRSFLTTGTAALATPALLRAQTVTSVIVIGGGSAGMTAADRLIEAGVDVILLEAMDRLGGRMDRDTSLADFPIDLGAEWIHDDPEVLGDILGNGWTETDVRTIVYQPQTYQVYGKDTLKDRNFYRFGYAETKFFDSTWYGFFERFVMPSILPNVRLNTAVQRIELTPTGVRAIAQTGEVFEADRVIVTTPISVLQSGQLDISANIATWREDALSEVGFGEGFKLFLKFAEQFYPDMLVQEGIWDLLDDTWDSKLYYNAAFGKETNDNVLGLFNVDQIDLPWSKLSQGQLIDAVLDELDDIYDGIARPLFQGAVVRNWSQTPFINGSYSMDNESDFNIAEILAPIEGRIHFAGEALGGNAQSTVHGAAYSAINVVEEILG